MKKYIKISVLITCIILLTLVFFKCKGDPICAPYFFRLTMGMGVDFDWGEDGSIPPIVYKQAAQNTMDMIRTRIPKICDGQCCEKNEVCIPIIVHAEAKYVVEPETASPKPALHCTVTVDVKCICVDREKASARKNACNPARFKITVKELRFYKTLPEAKEYRELREYVAERIQSGAEGICAGDCDKGKVCKPVFSIITPKYREAILDKKQWLLECTTEGEGQCKCR